MTPELLEFISNFIHLDEVDSTNFEARRLIREGHNENFVVLADLQTGGRGRGSNTWWSGRKSLTFSISLGNLPESKIAEIPLVVGLAVQKVLQALLAETKVTVKWPNDIMAGSKKICGILCETEKGTDGNIKLIIGVGINVNDTTKDVPESIKNIYVSISELLGRAVDESHLFIELLTSFKEYVYLFCQFGFAHFTSNWNDCDFLKNRLVEVGKHRGYVSGVSESGRLRLLVDNKILEVVSGSVNLL